MHVSRMHARAQVYVCVCACVRACVRAVPCRAVRACVRVCLSVCLSVCLCEGWGGGELGWNKLNIGNPYDITLFRRSV